MRFFKSFILLLAFSVSIPSFAVVGLRFSCHVSGKQIQDGNGSKMDHAFSEEASFWVVKFFTRSGKARLSQNLHYRAAVIMNKTQKLELLLPQTSFEFLLKKLNYIQIKTSSPNSILHVSVPGVTTIQKSIKLSPQDPYPSVFELFFRCEKKRNALFATTLFPNMPIPIRIPGTRHFRFIQPERFSDFTGKKWMEKIYKPQIVAVGKSAIELHGYTITKMTFKKYQLQGELLLNHYPNKVFHRDKNFKLGFWAYLEEENLFFMSFFYGREQFIVKAQVQESWNLFTWHFWIDIWGSVYDLFGNEVGSFSIYRDQ